MIIKKVLVILTVIFALGSCVSNTDKQIGKTTIEFTWPENGCIYEGELIEYVNGNANEPVPFNTYIWKSEEVGVYKTSWGPYYDTWFIELYQGSNVIEAKKTDWYTGGTFLVLKETASVNEITTANGIVDKLDSVTVYEDFVSWDGKKRTTLVQKNIVVDGSQGTFEQPLKGTYTLRYLTSEGVEKTETYTPSGELVSVQRVTNIIDEYSGE